MISRLFKGIIFDLDDTLYREIDFFRSGFSEVARKLEARGVGNSRDTCGLLEDILFNEGRDFIFEKAAVRLGFSESWVRELVELFREHIPSIELADDAKRVLPLLKRTYLLGCVTDGHARVQRRKIEALGVAPLFDAVVVADDLGRGHWKPDPLPFKVCCGQLGLTTGETVYVGDNVERDIQGAKNLGMRSVLLRREDAYFTLRPASTEHSADVEITTLYQLGDALARLLYKSIRSYK
ncbi:MAG TPA: HAD family hydrolase [Candidatus Aquicultor sp.]|jgi:putative hydrolase of the HAD superfamily